MAFLPRRALAQQREGYQSGEEWPAARGCPRQAEQQQHVNFSVGV